MVNCVIKNCKSRSMKGMKLYRVPPYNRYDNTLLSWMEFVRIDRPDWKPTPSSRLCGLHFTEDSFYKGTTGNKLLKRTAVPTIHVVNDEEVVGSISSKKESNNKSAKLMTHTEKEAVQPNETQDDGSKNHELDLSETSSAAQLNSKSDKKRKNSKSVAKEQVPNQTQVDKATLKKVSLLCRVCGQSTDKKSVSIFSPKGKSIALEEKILRFLHLTVSRKDVGMPQKVCSQCIMQLHKCQELYEMASKADTQFRDMLQPPPTEHSKPNEPSVAVIGEPRIDTEGDKIDNNIMESMEEFSEVKVKPVRELVVQDQSCQQVIAKKRSTSSINAGVSPKRKCKLQTREMNFEILVQHCSLCDLDLPSFSELQNHYLDIHQKYLCGLCTTSLHFFDSTAHLNQHHREIHSCSK